MESTQNWLKDSSWNLRIRSIENEDATSSPNFEAQRFCALYTRASGTPLRVEDIHGARLFGLYQGQHLRGGFVIRSHSDFRAIEAVQDAAERARLGNSTRDAMEITGLWADPELPRIASRLLAVLEILREARRQDCSRIVAITTKSGLWEKTYLPVGARELYRGLTRLGIASPRQGIVFELPIRELSRRLPFYLLLQGLARGPRRARERSVPLSESFKNIYATP